MANEATREDLSKYANSEQLYKLSKFLAKSVAGVLAPVGLAAITTELFDLIVGDPAAKRRDRFLMDLARRIDGLADEGRLTLNDLKDNEEVAALLFRAAQAAMRSSGEKKFSAIRECALKGLLSANAKNASLAQIVVGLLDRMTEYHVILLYWESRAHPSYRLGRIQAEDGDEARRSFFYGQPVFMDPKELEAPVAVFTYMKWGLYVERDDDTAFRLARADLAALGLLRPVLMVEQYLDGREFKRRTTPEIDRYELSELGRLVCGFMTSDLPLPGSV